MPKRAPFVLCAFQTRLTTHPTSKWNSLPGVQASAVTDGVPYKTPDEATAPTPKNTFAPLTVEVADVLEGVQVAEASSQDEQDQPHHIEPLVNGKGQNGNGGKNNVRRQFALFKPALSAGQRLPMLAANERLGAGYTQEELQYRGNQNGVGHALELPQPKNKKIPWPAVSTVTEFSRKHVNGCFGGLSANLATKTCCIN